MNIRAGITIENLVTKNNNSDEIINIKAFNIEPGEAICIRGANGTGKTTLLHILSGMTQHCSGHVSLFEENLITASTSLKEKIRTDHIGFIFQQYQLISYLSAFDNIMLPCYFSNYKKECAILRSKSKHVKRPEAYDAFRLIRQLHLTDPSRLSKKAFSYSAGQQQRFAVVRALIGSPALILADEPASAIDYKGRQAVYDLLLKESKETKAILLCTTHDAIETQGFDRTIDMSDINTAKEKENRWSL